MRQYVEYWSGDQRATAMLASALGGIGLPLAFAAAHTFASFLYGVRAWDPPAFTGAAAVLLVSVGAAAAIPARRATRTQPSASLRAS